ncbi:hypothetical protein KH5H1_18390 [Corallococcus caeni]|uniref:Uncharacterized protein n=1 Tax=Corallococcus caeni TaxID=3082388 RepID=A0ABQ6QTZ8_9BACT|nr:hypothetical protein KH5H1_18390 [Corallococcus sp. KH5-1]GMU07488.1 hypothetical protein ASNO1_37410 [Corallococcus sp. NO1]
MEDRHRLTVVRRLCGHVSTGPSGVFDQSMARINRPISPPPDSQSIPDSGGDAAVELAWGVLGCFMRPRKRAPDFTAREARLATDWDVRPGKPVKS